MIYLAHKDGERLQTIKEHSENTAKLSASFAIKSLIEIAYNIGLLHDIGKYQPSFQKRINGIDIRCPHALCGAIEVKLAGIQGRLSIPACRYCIAGHHTGLQDYGTLADSDPSIASLCATLNRCPEDYSFYKNDLKLRLDRNFEIEELIAKHSPATNQEIAEYFAFIVRYLFSCLTDADSLDTANFYTNAVTVNPYHSNFKKCLKLILEKLNGFTCTTELQKARGKIQKQALESSVKTGRYFMMNMPTGSGKTLCSAAWALQRCNSAGKKKIIYVIPYNSIIDQTATVFEQLFEGAANILRHQSTFFYDVAQDDNESVEYWKSRTIENWDADFIITTQVQFLESVHGNKRRQLRKLHNMEDAVIIFDEVHSMPLEFLEPSLKSVMHISKFLNTDILFLSATMPDFKQKLIEYGATEEEVVELVSDTKDFSIFENCSVEYIGDTTIESLLDFEEYSKLIVVNGKARAKEIFNAATGKKFHLSTYMTAADRIKTINSIKNELEMLKEKLRQEDFLTEEDKITVVSTSLIECGVDLDFHSAARELSGLDSIIQTAGRCNREGEMDSTAIQVFEFEDSFAHDKKSAITKSIIKDKSIKITSEIIKDYYNKIYVSGKDLIEKHRLSFTENEPYQIPFKTYAANFSLINDADISVVISQNLEVERQKKRAIAGEPLNHRGLQKYLASVNPSEFAELKRQKVIDDFNSGVYFLLDDGYYNRETGINLNSQTYII